LDYGCGVGAFVDFLEESGFDHVVGYDHFIEAYQDRRVLEEEYDVVTSYDVIEHVDDPQDFLRMLAKLSRPGGLVVIGTPNADYLSVCGGKADVELSQPYHRHILSERALLDLAAKQALRALHITRSTANDSLIPGMSLRFMWTYIEKTGGMIDVAFEPIRLSTVLRSPTLVFYTFLGYFFPPPGNMVVVFRRD